MSISRLYWLARGHSEYWREFGGAGYRFVLAEYPVPQMSKRRNRYSVFAFKGLEPMPRACHSWEPHDPEPGTLEAVLADHPQRRIGSADPRSLVHGCAGLSRIRAGRQRDEQRTGRRLRRGDGGLRPTPVGNPAASRGGPRPRHATARQTRAALSGSPRWPVCLPTDRHAQRRPHRAATPSSRRTRQAETAGHRWSGCPPWFPPRLAARPLHSITGRRAHA